MANPIVGTEDPDHLLGTKGDDTITALGGIDSIQDFGGNDTIDGGAGNDELYYFTKNLGISVDLLVAGPQNTGGAGTDTLISIESVYASTGTGNDNLAGTDGSNWLFSYQGNDTLLGRGGDDWLMTADGTKIVDGGDGTDTYSFNTVRINGVFIGATLSLSLQGQAQVSGTLTITLSGIENLAGSIGDDTLTGDAGVNKLAGGSGNDHLIGGGGNDMLAGDGVFQYDENRVFTFYPAIDGPVGNDILEGGAGIDTLTGGKGDDTYILDYNYGPGAKQDTVIEAADAGIDTVVLRNSGPYSFTAYTLGDNIENAEAQTYLLDAITLTGNALDNTLTGDRGADEIDGGLGKDLMIGGAGNDNYRVDNAADRVRELAGGGIDSVISATSYVLSDNVENLYLYLGGSNATGNAGKNELTGNGNNNILDGRAGADTMQGLGGDDTYVVDDKRDVVYEGSTYGGSGTDTVRSSISYTLGDGLDILRLTGTANLTGTGNALGNAIYGNDGNNVLNGVGGGDFLAGGLGDDTYLVNFGDRIDEKAGAGSDTVRSGGSYILAANLDNLVLTGTQESELTGNDLANTITGGIGNDTINGRGGADTMIGGAGDDHYFVDNAADRVVEARGGGTDIVTSTVDFSLAAFREVETLVLVGKTALVGTGNALDNTIVGNGGANTLDGGAGNDTLRGANGADTLIGGEGDDELDGGNNADIMDGGAGNDKLFGYDTADQLRGGTGDDLYYVDNAKSTITENADGGHDTVSSSATVVLAANVEDLILTGYSAISGTGNDLANTITGNEYGNVLNGGGGADHLIGGGGSDTFMVDNMGDTVEGTGVILASATYKLGVALPLTLTGKAAIDATGTAFDDTITGNTAANTIIGLGGIDRIDGGAGADTVRGDAGGDILQGGAGDDTVFGGADNDAIDGGTGNDSLRGDDGDDRISGGAGNDTLNGGAGKDFLVGGEGADTMAGGAGRDVYIVDNAGDKATDSGAAGDGIDVLFTSVSITAGSGIDVISAWVAAPGQATSHADIDLTGNAQDNFIVGNVGANRLEGGAGNDVLLGEGGGDTLIGGTGDDFLAAAQTATGGEGADRFGVYFSFANAPVEAPLTVTDFVHGTDKIVLTFDTNSAVIIQDGALSADIFVLGTQAADDNDRVIYDQVTGKLWMDADGIGTRAQQLVGNFGAGTVLALDDFEGLTNYSFVQQHQIELPSAFGYIF